VCIHIAVLSIVPSLANSDFLASVPFQKMGFSPSHTRMFLKKESICTVVLLELPNDFECVVRFLDSFQQLGPEDEKHFKITFRNVVLPYTKFGFKNKYFVSAG
jgi:hypothetical protein